MKILVQKFGGASLATTELRERAIRHVAGAVREGCRVVAVFSAIGRFPDPYATDTLLALIGEKAPGAHKDLLSACGELISCVVMADLLERAGIANEILPLDQIGIVTDDRHGDAEILEINPAPISAVLRDGKVAVIPGFQGVTRGGKVTTLGRGGSDITACALGAAFGAELVEIYKEVDGVYSADPLVVPDAFVLSEMTFQEVGEMAYHGAKVLHPKAVSFAMEHKIPIRIRSSSSESAGTLIAPDLVEFKNVVSGIAHIPNMAYVRVKIKNGNPGTERHRLFQTFADGGISLDLITVSQEGVAFIVRKEQSAKARELLEKMELDFSIEGGFAKVSVVGAGMRGKPGVMFRVVDALHKAAIAIYHSTDSHITIACLVKQADMENAVRALHRAFVGAP